MNDRIPAVSDFFSRRKVAEEIHVHLAHPKMDERLRHELNYNQIPILAHTERVFVTRALSHPLLFAGTTWTEPVLIPISSVKNAVQVLRERNRDWGLYSVGLHQRAGLIQEQLPQKRHGLLSFPASLPINPCGGWTLISDTLLLASRTTTSPFPNGIPHFDEDHHNPPSRAYLKLWEFFTRHPDMIPEKGDKVLDMGACPGGWTWVLSQLRANVISVDKAPLDMRLMQHPLINYLGESAFGLRPAHIGKIDLFCSDIICYPTKLLELVTRWVESGLVKRFICSVKFQGETDYDILNRFLEIQGSEVIHLFQNGHEVTWFKH